MKLTKENPKFKTAPNNLEILISDSTSPIQLINSGYWGMNIEPDKDYILRTIIKTSPEYKGSVTAKLISQKGDTLASIPVKLNEKNKWNDVVVTLKSKQKDARAKLALEFNSNGKVWVDYVSLFPKNTFKNRKNGLRKDIAEILVGLKPSFVRWPGGCVVEGISLENRFQWKKTLGDPAMRPGEYSTWGYRCSYGFGYFEMLQFCEDIGADAMYVCNVGLGCQFRMGDASSQSQIKDYLQDCLDAIEYAIGDTNTKWGARRASDGHAKPFPLKYVEIGNENWGDEYDKRFDIFYNAIKEKYPQLVLISNHGINGIGKATKTDMIDPHWYVTPDYFFSNAQIFDNLKRGDYTIYVGEYACNAGVGAGNMLAALSEAAFITGMQRNGDLVTMASYAPLLENRNDRNWSVNLIWLDTDQVLGRSSYYVQKMSAENRPDYNVKSSMTIGKPSSAEIKKGGIAFGSWATSVDFKDIKITQNAKTETLNILEGSDTRGVWKTQDKILSQTSMESATKFTVKDFSQNDFTLEMKVRKTSGKEGFLFYFGLTDNARDGYLFNVAGWNNSATSVEYVRGGRNAGEACKKIPHRLDLNIWYDVKIVITPANAKLFIDGKEIISYNPMGTPLQFFSTGYDEKGGELVVNVVNADSKAYPLSLNIEGAKSIAKSGKIITLSAKNFTDENSFEEPLKISPKEKKFDGFKQSFDYEFEPFSYTILRIKAKK